MVKRRPLPSVEEILMLVEYDECSPTGLLWKSDVKGRWPNSVLYKKGSVAGSVSCNISKRYSMVLLNGVRYLCHRIIYKIFNPYFDESLIVDHIDRNRTNNKISNLRAVIHAVNTRNKNKNPNNVSGVCGVIKKVNKDDTYYTAFWYDLDGKRKSKSFSWKVNGEEKAFEMACAYRIKVLQELNLQGAGYSDQHGI